MPRRAELDRPVSLNLKLPESIRARLDLALFSTLEGRVRQGTYQEFFLARIQEFFEWRRLDLGLFGFAPGTYVAGPKSTIDALEQRLKDTRHDT